MEEKLRLEREELEIEAKVRREQEEIRRREELEREVYHPWRYRNRDGINIFRDTSIRDDLGNTVKVPLHLRKREEHSNLFSDYDETINYALSDNQKTRKRDLYHYLDWYPYDSRVGELHRLLELRFQNSQTELKRKFYDNLREVKSEIDTKQFNMAKHLQELKNVAQREREEKEQLRVEVERLKKKEHDLKEREELMNSLLRNDMKYKTPPLPKVRSHASDLKVFVDPNGYNTKPLNIVNNNYYVSDYKSNNFNPSFTDYYTRNTAIPYFETNEFTMVNPDISLDNEIEIGDETDRIRKLQNDRLGMIETIETSMKNNETIDIIPSLEKIKKSSQKPFKITKKVKDTAMKRAERNKRLTENYNNKDNSYDSINISTNMSKSFKSKDINTIDLNPINFKFDDSFELELPGNNLIKYNNI